MKPQLVRPRYRLIRFQDTQIGIPTGQGLKVSFPGFRITPRNFEDGRPRNPWPNLQVLEEEVRIVFRDLHTMEGYEVAIKGLEREKNVHPLHDMVMKGTLLVLACKDEPDHPDRFTPQVLRAHIGFRWKDLRLVFSAKRTRGVTRGVTAFLLSPSLQKMAWLSEDRIMLWLAL